MSRGSLVLALLLAACQPPDAPNEAAPVNTIVVPQPAPAKAGGRTVEPVPAAPDPGAIEGLTPFQRRAYEKGFEDCRTGRYEPDRWPEAYRIGCAAAHDAHAG
ncbi:MAG: hypothetical protein E6G92_04945 [Alphaproteobacteria bacterium]|nr:MAG: hypothetical protein E6G92_04945 [Alphaproteobacteria bacterium]